jgi:prophage DNA circulation protein
MVRGNPREETYRLLESLDDAYDVVTRVGNSLENRRLAEGLAFGIATLDALRERFDEEVIKDEDDVYGGAAQDHGGNAD